MVESRRRSRRLQKSDDRSADEKSETSKNDEEDEMESSEDDESDEDVPRKKVVKSPRRSPRGSNNERTPQKKPKLDKTSSRRTSSRSNKFTSSMKEPGGGIADLLKSFPVRSPVVRKRSSLDIDSDSTPTKKKTKKSSAPNKSKIPKSPAIRHNTRRNRAKTEIPVSDDDDSEESDGEDHSDEDEGELKIQKIIACKSLTLKEWKKICDKMNTSEIENGSRWFQDDKSDQDEDTKFEERFLIKWADLSYLHCSWETEEDMLDQVEGAKGYLTTFFRKSVNGLLFDSDERADGEFFDPSFTQIERILDVTEPHLSDSDISPSKNNSDDKPPNFGIIFDKNHPDYEGGTGRQFLVKWWNTGYAENTYEFERDLILNEVEYEDNVEAFTKRAKKPSKAEMKRKFQTEEQTKRRLYKIFGDLIKDDEEKDSKIESFKSDLETQVFQNGGQLRDYQAEGVTWLIANYVNKRSSILADEMGLGKTIQTAVYVNLIAEKFNVRGPYLIIAPLSTIPHWLREFTSWTSLNTIVYHGSAKDREYIREFEFAYEVDRPSKIAFNQKFLKKCHRPNDPKWKSQWMVNVVITTPEMLVTDDFSELASVKWELVVVDEAHRLKNHSSKLAVNLRNKEFECKHKLLLTGTPIQNNMNELWTLLNIVDPVHFNSSEEFLQKYGDMKSKDLIDELHRSIRPYILRRLKEDVEKSVPPKEETLIEVELTVLQKQYYRALYEKNVQFLHRNHKKALDGPSINNLAMQLRKCCNHPFLLNGVENEEKSKRGHFKSNDDEADFLVKSSGKLVLLDKLLPKLKDGGHRVLIFSQFKIMLNILEDYLRLRKFKVERIDGSITGKKRQMAIDRFQAKDDTESSFVMLLSTRAGGVGINLTAADTCIIFDSDWNPQNDLQAQARCHRIGQTKSVKVYRLLSRKTYEMQMFHMSSLKMGLDQAVLQGFENGSSKGNDGMTKEEIEKLLRHGAYDIFNEEKTGSSEKESNDFIEQDIDSILERRTKTVIHENTGSQSNAAGGTFSKASFKAMNAGPNDTGDVDVDDPDFWKKVVGEAKAEELNDLTGKKRTRVKTNYNERDYERKIEAHLGDRVFMSSDEDYGNDDSSASSESNDSSTADDDFEFDFTHSGNILDETLTLLKESKKKKRQIKERTRWGGKKMTEWIKSDVEIIIKFLFRFGYGNISWEMLLEKVEPELSKKYDESEIKRMFWSIVLLTIQEAAEDDNRDARKKRETNKNSSDQGHVPDNNTPQDTDNPLSVPYSTFKKLWESNSTWATKALIDAINYSKTSNPRQGFHMESKSFENHVSPLTAAFNESVWPVLRSRGWKEERASNTPKMSKKKKPPKQYTYGSRTFLYIASVLDAVPRIHPELKNMITTIVSSVASKVIPIEETQNASNPLNHTLSINDITVTSLSNFLCKFAPVQLLVDRKSARIPLSTKMLDVLAHLHTAHGLLDLVNCKSSSPGSITSESHQKLKSLLTSTKISAIPHPLWNSNHDITLISAIVKHGWIGREDNCRAMNEDNTIKWGTPFEEVDGNDDVQDTKLTQTENEANVKVTMESMKKVALRVVSFLNSHSYISNEVKSFDLKNVTQTYGIVEQSKANASQIKNVWSLDESMFEKRFNETKLNGEQLADLPTRRDLLRRARALLSKASILVSSSKTEVESCNSQQDPETFSVLDQSNSCNLFLAEIIRAIMKSDQKGRKYSKSLLNVAIKESNERHMEDTSANNCKTEKAKSDEWINLGKICDHLKFVSRHLNQLRQSKNVLRVILGLPPLKAKSSSDNSVFPLERSPPSRINKPLNNNNKEANKPKSAAGDVAISKAMAVMRSRKNTTSPNTNDKIPSLRLTSIETLLMSVICSQGLPAFHSAWETLVTEDQPVTTDNFPGEEFQINWYLMGHVIEAAAKEWLNISTKKLQQVAQVMKGQSSQSDQLRRAEEDVATKKRTLREAEILCHSPKRLAQKSIMLMEALSVRMGSIEVPSDKFGNDAMNMNALEYGLGPYVLQWTSDHLFQWAEALSITKNGRPFATTESDFMDSHPEVKATAILDEKACRTIFIQVAQQTRLRSIFIQKGMETMSSLITSAVKNSQNGGDVWKARPHWWKTEEYLEKRLISQDDIDLLVGLLVYGYSGFDEFVKASESFHSRQEEQYKGNNVGENIQQITKSIFTRASVQQRVNQLTRELDILQRNDLHSDNGNQNFNKSHDSENAHMNSSV